MHIFIDHVLYSTFNDISMCPPISCHDRQCQKPAISGTSLTLTCSIAHGWGIYFFIGGEGMPGGANWTLEVVSWLHIGVWCWD